MFKYIIVIILLISSVTSSVIAADTIPRQEFIKIEDSCIDVLDELVQLFSNNSVNTEEAKGLVEKYELRAMKFNRYDKWDSKSVQYRIAKQTAELHMKLNAELFRMELALLGNDVVDFTPIRGLLDKEHEEISSKLLKYKNGSSSKKKSSKGNS